MLVEKMKELFHKGQGQAEALMLIANIILGIIVVLIFRRKRDIQSILTIEDFWGGILLGFIIGYGGKSFIEEVLPMAG